MQYKIVRQDLFPPFCLETQRVNLLAIERPSAFYALVSELYGQLNGEDGKIVLSANNQPLKIAAKTELLTQFVPFELNGKRMLNKLYQNLEKKALGGETLDAVIGLQTAVNVFMETLTAGELIDTEYSGVNLTALWKAIDLRICGDQDTLEEKLADYMLYVRELEGEKVFVLVNLLSYVNPERRELLYRMFVDHGHTVLLMEPYAQTPSEWLHQMIIDADLCVID